ncbi:MAG: hypothetical protein GWN59_02015, partial [Calditrichae bacterium]|nr:hypothetical protein [Calditrichia bacterium]
ADDIFVVSDVYGIKPDGSCNEIKGGHFGELKLNNVHWNANNKTIKLYGAKNEEVAVQIVIPQSGKGFWANMSNLEGPSTIQGGRATFSAMAWTNHKQM